MDAKELADEFDNRNWTEVDAVLWAEKSAAMLRQLQNRLDVVLVSNKQQDLVIKSLNTLMNEQDKKIMDLAWKTGYLERSLEIKDELNQLTDGEITILANKHLHHIECDYESTGVYKFARALLKEAKE